ncbi:hypothetical protein B296_00045652 [Ensete ventricosum]|uniref:Uncharacterized protein n=1 Tax=Ensete ventricosum TaxID=4639 RepID=A0A426XFR8_ENSVE|nr:hypothetical protein B296_00045652 [Ensete ventricosum]
MYHTIGQLWVFHHVLLLMFKVLFFSFWFFNRFYPDKLPLFAAKGKSWKSPEIWKCCISNHAEGLYAAGRAMALVLRASWFSLSSCSRVKEMAALSVYDPAYEERDSEQDEREVGYSPRGEEAPSVVPTGKKGHSETYNGGNPP